MRSSRRVVDQSRLATPPLEQRLRRKADGQSKLPGLTRVGLLIFCCLLYQFVNILPGFPQSSSWSEGSLRGVYAQLRRAVERRDWAQALRLVDLLLQRSPDPAQRQDLEHYRLALESHRSSNGDPPPPQWPFLHKPFVGEFPVTNLFDHDLPLGEEDGNGRFVSGQGQVWIPGPLHPCGKSDGHAGYDWAMPVGTPILAAAPGRVTVARPEPAFFCPALGRPVRGLRVRILHEPAGLETLYAHLSQIQVQEGQRVAAGEVIGLSGDSGCASGPHLHFEVRRLNPTNSGQPAPVDPYGWFGPGLDPWSLHPLGAESLFLWQVGQAPSLGACWQAQQLSGPPQ
ncbi:peptidase M23 [Synechococcus sp. 60AY4M2]|nr:peptidase M23 [Synechococcus sp. 60AY4M2]PIK98653.1 peptidase M23 [Synechococcus sp. 63AY4M1]PIL00622.1 peptidase M23 [Synechococcus sp. 65AY640]